MTIFHVIKYGFKNYTDMVYRSSELSYEIIEAFKKNLIKECVNELNKVSHLDQTNTVISRLKLINEYLDKKIDDIQFDERNENINFLAIDYVSFEYTRFRKSSEWLVNLIRSRRFNSFLSFFRDVYHYADITNSFNNETISVMAYKILIKTLYEYEGLK